MAKSAQSELREIARIEEAARRDLERAKNKRAQLVAPLAGKLASVFSDRVREFLGQNIETAVATKIDKKLLEETIDKMLSGFFTAGAPDMVSKDDETSGS